VKRFISLLFIPQPGNNHRARLLQPGFLALFIALYLLNQSFLKSLTIIKPGVLGYSSEITAEKVFLLTNQERQQAGLPTLRFNSTLSESAANKAKDMFANNYWAHNSPSGKSPWEFFKEAGYDYSVAGENLAKDFADTESLMKAWMKSPTHKANIINQKYQEIGIGVVNGTIDGIKTTLVVQHFGTPAGGLAVSDQTPEEISLNAHPADLQLSTQTLGQKSVSKFTNPLFLNKLAGSILFIFIIAVLFIDGYVTIKNGHHRFTGSSAGHIGFLAIIFIILLFTRQGTIF